MPRVLASPTTSAACDVVSAPRSIMISDASISASTRSSRSSPRSYRDSISPSAAWLPPSMSFNSIPAGMIVSQSNATARAHSRPPAPPAPSSVTRRPVASSAPRTRRRPCRIALRRVRSPPHSGHRPLPMPVRSNRHCRHSGTSSTRLPRIAYAHNTTPSSAATTPAGSTAYPPPPCAGLRRAYNRMTALMRVMSPV